MTSFARTDTSVLGRWWWTVDRWTLAALAVLLFVGALLTLAGSPPVAARIGFDSFYLARHHFALLPAAVAIVVGVSLLGPRGVRRLAAIGLLPALALTGLTLAFGAEVKGATRWISVAGFSLQPSEFIKPTFAVVAAWCFAARNGKGGVSGNAISVGLYGLVVGLLMLQPDLGMAFLVSATWFAQFFLAGLPMGWVVALGAAGVGAAIAAYAAFPHVGERVDGFLDPASGDSYQIDRSLEAFMNGGLTGRGPGEGTVKALLPDAHADFIFAVAGEEFGLLACLFIVGLFAFVVLRGVARLLQESNRFVLLAATGLLVTFGLQALINMASTLRLMPTKGMTLPFISYGGSSLLALSLGMGMVLALTRRRVGAGDLA